MNHLPLHDVFVKKGATFIPFASWEVPAYFTSIIDEHNVVRNKAGIFDISHMGVIEVEGSDAASYLQYLISNDMNTLHEGGALYTPLCNEAGGIIDDIFIYKISETKFFLIVNAVNHEKDFSWFASRCQRFSVELKNVSGTKALFALQGPLSPDIMKAAWDIDLLRMPYHSFITVSIDNSDVIIATTGYTGEIGCEIICMREKAVTLWNRLFDAGRSFGLQPIGFGARDTLRLEAGCLLYGNDMNDTTTPLEAGLGWTVKLEKDDFIGKAALVRQKKEGIGKQLIAFELIDRGVARHEYPILKNNIKIGEVTSGSLCPTMNKNMGFGYVDSSFAHQGEEIFIAVRKKLLKALIVKKPFYKRRKCGPAL
ncbi:MAG: glycine cleavage system aminomethyltransferase GcvT [Candidatus Omnitrophica bacterium]|nr:glycine cleavage system aminomethyltransferase GcvT [Candidatus Omnitrophota bacterium]